MKKMAIYLAAPLLLVSTLASAATQGEAVQHPHPHEHRMPGMMPPPPMPMPVYAVTQTTSTPSDTLKTLVSQVPQVSAGKYQVKIEVLPLPPQPGPGPAPAPAEHPANH